MTDLLVPTGARGNGIRRQPSNRALVAAAKRLDLGSAADVAALKRNKRDALAAEAWTYWRTVPEVKFLSRFVGHCMSRLRLYPGVVVDPDEPPLFIGDAAERTDLDMPVPEPLAAAAVEELARVAHSEEGQAGLLRSFGSILSVTGDTWLVGRELADDPLIDEQWGVYHDGCIVAMNDLGEDRVGLREDEKDAPTMLSVDDAVIRVWRRDDQWPKRSDSAIYALLDVLEEMLIWARVFRSIARTRAAPGYLLVPTELDFDNERAPVLADLEDPVDPHDETDDDLTDLEAELVEASLVGLRDETDALAVVAKIVRGKAEYLKEFRPVIVERKIDEYMVGRVASLIERFARTVDVPAEVVLGIGDVNHWGAWQIEDATYKTAIEPTAEIPASAIGSKWLRVALLDRGFPVEQVRRVVVGIDPSMLVARPNQGQDGKDAHERLILSNAGLRKRLGIGDGDAPTPDEMALRLVQKAGVWSPEITARVLENLGVLPPGIGTGAAPDEAGGPPADEPVDAEGDQPIPDTDEPDDGEVPPAVAASSAVTAAAAGNRLGERLTAIEQRTRDRLMVAAGSALTEALRTAGNRLRSRAQGDAELRVEVNGVAPQLVGHVIGEERAAALADADELLVGAFDGLRGQWDAWVSAAQADVAQVMMAEADDPDEGEEAAAEWSAGADGRRDAGWIVLAAALLSMARGQLFRAAVDQPLGEASPSVPVPAGPVRDALSVAGGGAPGQPTGLTSGPAGHRAVIRLQRVVQAWEWRVGQPERPFEPHQVLDGGVFLSFDDDVAVLPGGVEVPLVNAEAWPPFGRYFPGDHPGCQCDAVPVMVRPGELD